MNLSKLGIRGTRRSLTDGILQPGKDLHCPKRACRALLRLEVQLGGVVVAICDPCERNKKGLCRLCPKPMVFKSGQGTGNAQFCPECRTKHRKAYREKWYWQNHEQELRNRKRYQEKNHDKILAYAAEYRRTHPKKRDDLDRLYHRIWTRNAWKDPEYRRRDAERRQGLRDEKRKAKVLAGEIVKLTDRDAIWIWEAALGRRFRIEFTSLTDDGSFGATGTAPRAGHRTPGTTQRSAVA